MLQAGNFIASIPADKEQSGTNAVSLKSVADQRSMPIGSVAVFLVVAQQIMLSDNTLSVPQRIGSEVRKSCTLLVGMRMP